MKCRFLDLWGITYKLNTGSRILGGLLEHITREIGGLVFSVYTMQGEVSSSAANAPLSTLAFLGQQLRQFSSSMLQQRQQNESLGFSLSVNGQEQGHGHQNQQQQQQQQRAQSMLLNGGQVNGGNRTGMFQHLHQQGSIDSSLDSQQQFSNQMMNSGSSFSESLTSQVMVEQNVQGIMEHLSMLQERIQQLQALVPLIAQTAHCQTDSNVVAQQQAASAAVVSIISQLAMVAIGLLPQQPFTSGVQQVNQSSSELPLSQLLQAAVNPTNFFQSTILPQQRGSTSTNNVLNANMLNTAPVSSVNTGVSPRQRPFSNGDGHAFPVQSNETDPPQPGRGNSPLMSLHNQITNKDFGSSKTTCVASNMLSNAGSGVAATNNNSSFISDLGGMDDLDNDSRVEDEDSDGDNLPPGSFDLVELDATEILAEHTHFCEICGKGFKRDANLRMHMRGHGDEYKTPAALARPDRGGGGGGGGDGPHDAHTVTRSRRFSCPYVGCKRNKKHRKFQPLKTMLCVKNHYRRSHCPKLLMCQKCMTKKFSVVADLKTHEKHCGRDKWLCSCGTTFSRKDKLFGHIGLFQGHTPAMPMHEPESGSLVESPTEGSFGSETKSSMRFWD